MSVIEVNNLKKHFGDTKAVDGISFNVEKGEIFGFLGPNGAGKTTTIRCMMDFIRPTDGSISILGKNAQKDTVELKSKIGYLSETARLYKKWTGQMHIDFLAKLNGNKKLAETLVKRFDFDPTIKSKRLSSGNKRKLGLILTFMHEPDVIILDEPTVALDPLLQHSVYELLEEASQRGATVFMSSHNMNEVERVCGRIGIIKNGKMAAVESIKSIKEKLVYTVTVYFKEPVDKKELAGNGVEVTKELPNGFALSVKGDINALIDRIEKFDLEDIEIHHASLEDIFLEYYE